MHFDKTAIHTRHCEGAGLRSSESATAATSRLRAQTKQLIRVMKLSLILLTACLTASAGGFTQTVSLSVSNAPLTKIFEQVKKQTGYSFIWDEKTIKNTKSVTLNVKSATIEQVMDICTKDQPITYTIIDKLVLIKARVIAR